MGISGWNPAARPDTKVAVYPEVGVSYRLMARGRPMGGVPYVRQIEESDRVAPPMESI